MFYSSNHSALFSIKKKNFAWKAKNAPNFPAAVHAWKWNEFWKKEFQLLIGRENWATKNARCSYLLRKYFKKKHNCWKGGGGREGGGFNTAILMLMEEAERRARVSWKFPACTRFDLSVGFIAERTVHLAHGKKYRAIWQYITQYLVPGKVVEIEREILWLGTTVPTRKKKRERRKKEYWRIATRRRCFRLN